MWRFLVKRGVSTFIPFGNPGLFDQFVQSLDVEVFETPLMRIGKIVKWELFEPIVMKAVVAQAKGPGGRPRFHPLLMFKVLVLQRLHGLADDATSFQITDRNSFRAFLGLTAGDLVPDGQTISDFRDALIASKGIDALFDAFLEHLQKEHGLALAKQGVMIDASFCEVPRQRNSREENAQIKAGKVPEAFEDNPKRKAHKDLDARWTKKQAQTFYGYKDHLKVDVKDKLILKAVVTPASETDGSVVERLIEAGDKVVYADSAYQRPAILTMLAALKVEAQINEKGVRMRKLTEEQRARNREKSKTRSRVEHVFGQMSGSMKALYQRFIGIARNAACLMLTNLVYNLMRFEQIKRCQLSTTA
jgi:IS5 family transposase